MVEQMLPLNVLLRVMQQEEDLNNPVVMKRLETQLRDGFKNFPDGGNGNLSPLAEDALNHPPTPPAE